MSLGWSLYSLSRGECLPFMLVFGNSFANIVKSSRPAELWTMPSSCILKKEENGRGEELGWGRGVRLQSLCPMASLG